MNDDEDYEFEIVDTTEIDRVDDLIDEALKERGSYCNTCNTD